MADIHGSAIFSEEEDCPVYRWRLDRWWRPGTRALVCMLNPSYAGADRNDPTINKLIAMIQALDYDGFTVVNWSPYIATDPQKLHAWRWDHHDMDLAAGMRNLALVRELAPEAAVRIVAWGNGVPHVPYTQRLLRVMACDFEQPLMCFGRTKSKAPIHPLARGRSRIAPGTPLEVFREAA